MTLTSAVLKCDPLGKVRGLHRQLGEQGEEGADQESETGSSCLQIGYVFICLWRHCRCAFFPFFSSTSASSSSTFTFKVIIVAPRRDNTVGRLPNAIISENVGATKEIFLLFFCEVNPNNRYSSWPAISQPASSCFVHALRKRVL